MGHPEREWKNIVQAYLACISFVDHQVGIVLDDFKTATIKIILSLFYGQIMAMN